MKKRPQPRQSPPPKPPTKTAFAIVAHPDDIEFYMAGTLLLLGEAGYDLHYMTVSSGSCGSTQFDARATRAIRRKESQAAASILGARWHPSLTDDLEIVYDLKLLRRLAAIIRDVQPTVVLTHPPVDYMEDHANTCRLAVTALFARGMPNFRTVPVRPPFDHEATLYHCMPHGLCDPLRRAVTPEFFIDTEQVHDRKRDALAAHASQRNWLDRSQGMDSYLNTMDEASRAVGRMSGRLEHAEGWWRHLHLGFCGETADPIRQALAKVCFPEPASRTADAGNSAHR